MGRKATGRWTRGWAPWAAVVAGALLLAGCETLAEEGEGSEEASLDPGAKVPLSEVRLLQFDTGSFRLQQPHPDEAGSLVDVGHLYVISDGGEVHHFWILLEGMYRTPGSANNLVTTKYEYEGPALLQDVAPSAALAKKAPTPAEIWKHYQEKGDPKAKRIKKGAKVRVTWEPTKDARVFQRK